MVLIALGIFTMSYLIFAALVGAHFALYLSVAMLLIFWRCYSALSGASSFMKELNEQTNFSHIYHTEFLSPEGKRLENDFCIVEILPKMGYCYITEKQLLPSEGYHKMEIKNSYKTGDFYGAIIELFEFDITYDALKNLAQLCGISYKEIFIAAILNTTEKEEEQFTMPTLQVDIEEPKVDNAPEIKYNEERKVDL